MDAVEQAIEVIAESEEDDEDEMNETETEEQLLKHYFYSGCKYNEIILFLDKHHHVSISYSLYSGDCKSTGYKGAVTGMPRNMLKMYAKRVNESTLSLMVPVV